MSSDNNRFVVPNKDGGWDVKASGAQRASAHTRTQKEAIDRAREIIENKGGGELSIANREGKIRAKDTIPNGNDPRNIPG